MLRVIDRSNGVVIQKVLTPRGKCLGYQVSPEGSGDTSLVTRFATLEAARNAGQLGRTVHNVVLTKPKAEHAQNQPGYRADSQRAKSRR